jgi:hypothetical protein
MTRDDGFRKYNGQAERTNGRTLRDVPGDARVTGMRVILLTNDPVQLSFAEAALRAEGVICHVLDASTSAAEGSIGAIPRRLVVSEADESAARLVLAALGLEPSRV